MITTKGVELPEGNIANAQDSYKYFWDPTGTILGCKRVNHSQIPTEGSASPEQSAEWEEQDLSHQQLCPTSFTQIPAP